MGIGPACRGPGRDLAGPGRGLAGPGRGLAGPGRGLAGPGKGLAGPGRGLAGPGRDLAGPGKGLADLTETWPDLAGLGRAWPGLECADLGSANRKITRLSGQAAAPGAASPGPVKVAWWSGCLGEGDGVAEGFELADVVAGLALLVDAAGVVTGAEVVVAGGGIGEQVPDDHQDGAGDGDHGLELAPAPGQAPVAFPQEGVGPAGRGGGLAEHSLEVGVTLDRKSTRLNSSHS